MGEGRDGGGSEPFPPIIFRVKQDSKFLPRERGNVERPPHDRVRPSSGVWRKFVKVEAERKQRKGGGRRRSSFVVTSR